MSASSSLSFFNSGSMKSYPRGKQRRYLTCPDEREHQLRRRPMKLLYGTNFPAPFKKNCDTECRQSLHTSWQRWRDLRGSDGGGSRRQKQRLTEWEAGWEKISHWFLVGLGCVNKVVAAKSAHLNRGLAYSIQRLGFTGSGLIWTVLTCVQIFITTQGQKKKKKSQSMQAHCRHFCDTA